MEDVRVGAITNGTRVGRKKRDLRLDLENPKVKRLGMSKKS